MLLRQPHHDGSEWYVENAAPDPGDVVGLRLWVPHGGDGTPAAGDVALRVVRDGEALLRPAVAESTDDTGTWWRAELTAANHVNSYRFLLAGKRRV